MIYRYLLVFTLCCFSLSIFAQKPASKSAAAIAEAAYQKRIVQSSLQGVYIPKDLSDAFVQFNKLIEKPTQVKFKSLPEEQADRRLHNGFGKWISFNYAFFEGSRFSVYLNKLGLHDPNDMITFVITTYHRNLNKEKLDVKPLLEKLIAHREKVILERRLGGEVISTKTRKLEVHPDSIKQN